MQHAVSIVTQSSYESGSLTAAISQAIFAAGFDMGSVKGRSVLLKPNMLGAFLPEMGATTHPSFVRAVIEIFQSADAIVSVGDSPNGVHTPDEVWRTTGIRDVCVETGAKEVQFEKSGSVERGGFMIARAVLSADIIINLPKFKTHGLTALTLAVKNLFGCVNGMIKTRYHREFSDRSKFCKQIVAIANEVSPSLSIVDGITAMAGNGPSGGIVVQLGAIVAGTNMYAVDSACADIVGIQPMDVETIAAAVEMGQWSESNSLHIAGERPTRFAHIDFPMPSTFKTKKLDWWISRVILSGIWNGLSVKPKINPKKCIHCNMCYEACPVKAISRAEGQTPPLVNGSKCIECFCCHEVCPESAIDLKGSPLLRIARFFSDRRRRKVAKRSEEK
jgi:uncharacterized protein (DUF362 family)/ferredoxin